VTEQTDAARPRGRRRKFGMRTVVLWACANSFAGLVIGCAIRLFAESGATPRAIIPISIVFANVVGFAALLAVRFVLPRYSGYPAYIRVPMAVVTLIAGGVFGTALAILVNPFLVLYQMRSALMVLCLNGLLALIVGLITYTYEQMKGQIEREARERGKLENEMRIARDIQTELLPKDFPSIQGIDIFGFSVPARHVGGDCFDVIRIDDERLAVTIGDVSGKGTPAAILMANVQAAVRVLTESGVEPARLIDRVNRLVHGYTEESTFITFFYAVLNTRSRELAYVNAGHNPPCVLRANGSREYLETGGLVIGIMPSTEYSAGKAKLSIGDSLVLFTDGITEATNPNDEMYGDDRLEELLVRHRHSPAREIEERVYTSIKDFTAGAAQTDDLTMVIVKVVETDRSQDYDNEPGSSRSERDGSSAARGALRAGVPRGPVPACRSGGALDH